MKRVKWSSTTDHIFSYNPLLVWPEEDHDKLSLLFAALPLYEAPPQNKFARVDNLFSIINQFL